MSADPHVPDRLSAWVTPDAEGAWTFEVQAWSDPLSTWQHDAGIKIPAGIDVELMFTEGRLLLERVAAGLESSPEQKLVTGAIDAAGDTDRPVGARLAALQDPELLRVLHANPLRDLLSVEGPFRVYADRARALFGSWYEFFPRSEGATIDPETGQGHRRQPQDGGASARRRCGDGLRRGLPPADPSDRRGRTARDRTTPSLPAPTTPDPRGRSAVRHGGHDAIHPDLGTFDDFDAFVARAGELGLEVALDLALQCAPDHPWATQHPEWFTTRADGSIAYAENPPKKYQDIYPLNFDNDPKGLSKEILRVVKLWMKHGVRIFRVDNPHTKPVAFWEWLLAEIRRTDPDVIFLAEAFTRPAMMRALGAVGFHQSYTYFTWRNARGEIEDYLRELARETDHLMRPNFFVNTPDILHAYLQYGGPAAFKIRATLAATSSPSWGVYAGFELFEHVAVKPGSEEYLDSEKYQVRVRDWEGAAAEGRTLAPYLRRLNELRRDHPALQLLRNITIHSSDDDNILVYSKHTRRPDGELDLVIVVINLDPHSTRETMVHLDLPGAGDGLARLVPGARRLHRRDLDVGPAQLRPAGPGPRTGARADRQEDHVERRQVDRGGGRGRARGSGVVQDGRVLRGPGPVLPRLQRRRDR